MSEKWSWKRDDETNSLWVCSWKFNVCISFYSDWYSLCINCSWKVPVKSKDGSLKSYYESHEFNELTASCLFVVIVMNLKCWVHRFWFANSPDDIKPSSKNNFVKNEADVNCVIHHTGKVHNLLWGYNSGQFKKFCFQYEDCRFYFQSFVYGLDIVDFIFKTIKI